MTLLSLQRKSIDNYAVATSADAVLKRRGILELPAGKNFLMPRMLSIREGMKRITNDPAGLKLFPWHDMVIDAYGPRYTQEVGLKVSDPNDDEQKWTFHYMPQMVAELERSKTPLEGLRQFFNALLDLDAWSLQIALSVAKTFDATNARADGSPKYPGSLVHRISRGSRVIRVLRYPKSYAKLHIDRSLFTIHPWSSHKGLTFVGFDGSVIGVHETDLNVAAIFSGEKFVAATRGMFGLGTLHGVQNLRQERSANDEDRFAVVCFVHPQTLTGDAQWLLNNRHLIEEYEAENQGAL